MSRNIKRFFTKKTVIAAIGIGITASLILGFSSDEKINYIIEPVTSGEIKKTITATGEVGALELISVGAQVSGQVKKLNAVIGQKVKKGDLIAQIDSTMQLHELSMDKAKLKSYTAQLEAAKASVKVAKLQYEREKELAAKDFTSKENLENAEKGYIDARTNVVDLEAMIEQAKIAIKTGEVNLGYTTIVAPANGTILAVFVKEGQTINANQYTPTIVQMADLSKMAILIQISEGDITKIKPGMSVTYSILSEPEQVYQAKLVSIDPGLTTLTNGAYTGIIDANTAVYYYGRAVADNHEGKLSIGMTTQNEIVIAGKDGVLKVPSLAIYEKDGKKYVDVMIKEKGIPNSREVLTGISDSMYTEIVSGLQEGESVINGQTREGEIVNAVDIF